MNYLLFYSVLCTSITILTWGCSSGQKHFIIESSSNAVGNESLARSSGDWLKRLSIEGTVVTKSLVKCYQNEDIEQTLQILKKSLEQEKNNPLYWNTIGSCYFLSNDYPTANFYYLLSLSNCKNSTQKAMVHNNIGMIHLRNESFQNALLYFQKAIELDRNLKTPYFNLGQVFLKYGVLEKAQENFTFLYKTGQHDMDILFSLGMINLLKNNLNQAISFFSKIDPVYLKREDISTFYAWTSYLQKNPTQAEIILDMQQIKINPLITEMRDALIDMMKKDAIAEEEQIRKLATVQEPSPEGKN